MNYRILREWEVSWLEEVVQADVELLDVAGQVPGCIVSKVTTIDVQLLVC